MTSEWERTAWRDPDHGDRQHVMQHGVGTQGDLLEEAERLRDEGIARVTEWSDPEIIRRIDHLIRALNTLPEPWSANDMREILPDWIAEAKPQLIGARVRAAAMRKEMTRVGYTPSTLASTHSHPIAVWKGVT